MAQSLTSDAPEGIPHKIKLQNKGIEASLHTSMQLSAAFCPSFSVPSAILAGQRRRLHRGGEQTHERPRSLCLTPLSCTNRNSVVFNHILKQRHSDTKRGKSKATSTAGRAMPTSQSLRIQILGGDEEEGVKNTPGFQTLLLSTKHSSTRVYSLSLTKALWRR